MSIRPKRATPPILQTCSVPVQRPGPRPFFRAAAAADDRRAAADLLPLVYGELRRLAAEPPGHALGPTALVHEAYLRLVGGQSFDDRGHFFAAAAGVMLRLLVVVGVSRASRSAATSSSILLQGDGEPRPPVLPPGVGHALRHAQHAGTSGRHARLPRLSFQPRLPGAVGAGLTGF
jgi:hypothetical protein